MINPNGIKETLLNLPETQELISELDAALATEENMKSAICGAVIIRIPKSYPTYLKILIIRIYTEAGWKKVETENYSYKTNSMFNPLGDTYGEGTKFIFSF